MKIILGYDGSDSANAALADMRRAGLAGHAEAMVVSIADEPLMPPPPPSAYQLLETTTKEDAIANTPTRPNEEGVLVERGLEVALTGTTHVRSTFPRWHVQAESLLGAPGLRLIQKANEWKADLLIVGARRPRLLERLMADSVPERIVTEATCSVRIGRQRSPCDDSPITLVVGVDGSVNSLAAVREVARRQWPKGTHARIVAATHEVAHRAAARAADTLWPELWGQVTNVDQPVVAETNAAVAAEELCATGLQVTTVVTQGDPKLVLVEEAQKSAADCIFVGATRFGWLRRLLARSVSLWVAMRAPCSVEVVRKTGS